MTEQAAKALWNAILEYTESREQVVSASCTGGGTIYESAQKEAKKSLETLQKEFQRVTGYKFNA